MRGLATSLTALIACAVCQADAPYSVEYHSFRLHGALAPRVAPPIEDQAMVPGILGSPSEMELMPGLTLKVGPDGTLTWNGDVVARDPRIESVAESRLSVQSGRRYQIVSEGEPVEYLAPDAEGIYALERTEQIASSRFNLVVQSGDDGSVAVELGGETSTMVDREAMEGVDLAVGKPVFAKHKWESQMRVPHGDWLFVMTKEPVPLESGYRTATPPVPQTLFKIVLKNRSQSGGGFGGSHGGGAIGGGRFRGGGFGGGGSSGNGGFDGRGRAAGVAQDSDAVYGLHLIRVTPAMPAKAPRQVSAEFKFIQTRTGTATLSLKQLTDAEDIKVFFGDCTAYRVPLDPARTDQYQDALLEALDRNDDTEILSAPRVTTTLAGTGLQSTPKLVTRQVTDGSNVLDQLTGIHPRMREFMADKGVVIADVAEQTFDEAGTKLAFGVGVGLRVHPTESPDRFRVEMLSQLRNRIAGDPPYEEFPFRVDFDYTAGDLYIFTTPMTNDRLLLLFVTIDEVDTTGARFFSTGGQESISADINGDGQPEQVPVRPRKPGETPDGA